MTSLHLGQRVAPPRFVMFALILIAGLAIAVPRLGGPRGTMAAFDVAAGAYLAAILPVMLRGGADHMRASSRANDANRVWLLLITTITSTTVLAAIVSEKLDKASGPTIALVLVSLALAWTFSNTIYALHYAHLYYLKDDDGSDNGGLDFPECREPDYWDFVYFSFTLGMTFQTSDVDITDRWMRRIVTVHCLAAFVFNLGILAFTINTIGGG